MKTQKFILWLSAGMFLFFAHVPGKTANGTFLLLSLSGANKTADFSWKESKLHLKEKIRKSM